MIMSLVDLGLDASSRQTQHESAGMRAAVTALVLEGVVSMAPRQDDNNMDGPNICVSFG